MKYVYGFYETVDTGDYNNVKALYQHLQGERLQKEQLLPNSALPDIIEEAKANPGKSYRLITVGAEGAKQINAIDTVPANVHLFWTGHQTTPTLEEAVAAGKINTVFIASTGISRVNTVKFQEQATVVALPGVPVEQNEEKLLAEYQAKKDAFLTPAEGQKRIVFFVGGDAPDLNGTIRRMDETSAYRVGEMLVNHLREKNAVIEIVNGPRTGQYNAAGEEILAHDVYDRKTGERLNVQEDPVTQQIRGVLEANGLQEGRDFNIHNFRFGTQKLTKAAKEALGNQTIPNTSMYDAAMGLVLSEKDTVVLYTGESITEGSKCAQYLTGRQNDAVIVPSMHDGHSRFVGSLHSKGYIGVINPETREVKIPEKQATDPLDVLQMAARKLGRNIERSTQLAAVR